MAVKKLTKIMFWFCDVFKTYFKDSKFTAVKRD